MLLPVFIANRLFSGFSPSFVALFCRPAQSCYSTDILNDAELFQLDAPCRTERVLEQDI
jgi:hypothetical protein